MKKIFLIIFTFFTLCVNAQPKVSYKICKDVNIHSIVFTKSNGNYYSKAFQKELIELKFTFEKHRHDKIKSFLTKRYSDELYNNKKKETRFEIDTSYFYELIENLNLIETENLVEDWNIADGIVYSIELSGENYNIRLSDNLKEEKNLVYFDFFESVWNKFK